MNGHDVKENEVKLGLQKGEERGICARGLSERYGT